MKTVLDHAEVQVSQYDADFYIWTQEQAALLRQVPRDSFALDIENLAEEIESMGRAEISKVSSLLRQVLIHLLKMAMEPSSLSQSHWVSEILTFQYDAVAAFTPGMRQRIDLARVWDSARKTVSSLSGSESHVPSLPTICPFSLDELLAVDFDLSKMTKRMARAIEAASRSPD